MSWWWVLFNVVWATGFYFTVRAEVRKILRDVPR